MHFARVNKIYFLIAGIVISLLSCEKKEIDFGGSTLSEDPNIITIDTVSVSAYTMQLDSFNTLNTGYFVTGNHYDSVLGNFKSTAYFDVTLPYDSTATLKNCTSCYFDSLVMTPQMSGGYYGDTTSTFTVNVNQLTQLIAYNSFGYNTSSIPYNDEPVGSFSAVISPSRQNTLRIRIADNIGQGLFNKIVRNSDTATISDDFLSYMKGFCLTSPSANNVVYYMKPVSDSNFLTLYYHKNAPLPVNYIVKLPLNTAHQFNGYTTDYTGTNLAVFSSKKQQTFASDVTGGYVYVDGNRALFPKIIFPSLYSLKELDNYVNIISATLEIYPMKGSFGQGTFYTLPPALNAYLVNEYDVTQGYVTDANGDLQTGKLSIDYLYSENTKYSFDVTSYIKTALAEGRYASLYINLQLPTNAANSASQRLILQALNNNSFKLKLNVLGL